MQKEISSCSEPTSHSSIRSSSIQKRRYGGVLNWDSTLHFLLSMDDPDGLLVQEFLLANLGDVMKIILESSTQSVNSLHLLQPVAADRKLTHWVNIESAGSEFNRRGQSNQLGDGTQAKKGLHEGALLFGGNGEIRTHGRFPVVGFQDRCNRPLCHVSKNFHCRDAETIR